MSRPTPSVVTALFPGSFDPVTLGHLEILARARHLFGRVILGVAAHHAKAALFSPTERVELLERLTAEMPDVSVVPIDGLLVDAARDLGADLVVRGLRGATDLEYEQAMAHTNHQLRAEHETVFLLPAPELAHISSSLVRQIARLGGDVSSFLPSVVHDAVRARLDAAASQSDE